MQQHLDLADMLKQVAKEIEHDENTSMEELIKDLILSSSSDGATPLNQNARIEKIISIISHRDINEA
jgi:hypothetical protein